MPGIGGVVGPFCSCRYSGDGAHYCDAARGWCPLRGGVLLRGLPAPLGHSRLVMECTVLVSAMMKWTLLPGGITSRERVPALMLKMVSARALLNQLAGSSEITKVTRPGPCLHFRKWRHEEKRRQCCCPVPSVTPWRRQP